MENVFTKELLKASEVIAMWWGTDVGYAFLYAPKLNEPFSDFLKTYCAACGGDWVNMILSGIHELYPELYKMIPDDLGPYPFKCAVAAMELLGIDVGK